MVRYFQVAGLTFSVAFPEDFPADRIRNYDPFEVHPAGPGPECIFSLTVDPEHPPVRGEVIYHAPEESGEPVVSLLRTDGGWQAEFASSPGAPLSGILTFCGDFRSGSLYANGAPGSKAFALNNALMLLYAFASARHDALEMHSSVVMHGGRGFMFLGRSGTGKSTHSSLWLKHIEGTELLNDDNPVLRIVDGSARVFGTPWSGKTPCYKAQDVPVGAIVRLHQAPHNAISRLGTIQAYASVLSSSSGFRPFREVTDAQHGTISTVAFSVPCYELDCLPDEAAARLCQQTVDG